MKRESSTGTASASSQSSIEGEYDAAAAASATNKLTEQQVNKVKYKFYTPEFWILIVFSFYLHLFLEIYYFFEQNFCIHEPIPKFYLFTI